MTAYEVATLACRIAQQDATRWGQEAGYPIDYLHTACDLLDAAQQEIDKRANRPDPTESIALRRECGVSE